MNRPVQVVETAAENVRSWQKLTFALPEADDRQRAPFRPFAANAAGAESGRSSQSRWRDCSWLGSSRSDLALRRWPRTARSTPRERRPRLRARPFERLAVRRINQPAAAGHAAPSEVVESQQPADRKRSLQFAIQGLYAIGTDKLAGHSHQIDVLPERIGALILRSQNEVGAIALVRLHLPRVAYRHAQRQGRAGRRRRGLPLSGGPAFCLSVRISLVTGARSRDTDDWRVRRQNVGAAASEVEIASFRMKGRSVIALDFLKRLSLNLHVELSRRRTAKRGGITMHAEVALTPEVAA